MPAERLGNNLGVIDITKLDAAEKLVCAIEIAKLQ
jgi:hypothetical protein